MARRVITDLLYKKIVSLHLVKGRGVLDPRIGNFELGLVEELLGVLKVV